MTTQSDAPTESWPVPERTPEQRAAYVRQCLSTMSEARRHMSGLKPWMDAVELLLAELAAERER